MRKLEVDNGVLLFGIRVTYWPLCLEVFLGRYGWVLFGKEDKI
jgi:hypothetical protein